MTIRRVLRPVLLSVALALSAASTAAAFGGRNGPYAYEYFDGRSISIELFGDPVAKITRPGTVFSHPRWSADGLHLLMTGTSSAEGRQLWAVDVSGGSSGDPYSISVTGLHRLTASGAGDNSDGAWSPDGRQIAYVHTPSEGVPEVWRMRADGTARRQLAWSPRGSADPDWSPDGREIAFTTWPVNAAGALPRIFAMDAADGTGKRKITVAPGRRPAWSPDGAELLFETATGSQMAIVRRDGRRLRRVGTVDEGGQLHWPRWLPDGSGLVFIRDNRNRIPHDPNAFMAPALMSLAGGWLPGLQFVYGDDLDWAPAP